MHYVSVTMHQREHARGSHRGGHQAGLTGHENPWHQPEHAQAWIERTRETGRDRGQEFGVFAALLPIPDDAEARVLELGAGAGGLTGVLLEQFPRVRVLALDLSPVMIGEGQRRLAAYGQRVEFLEWDLERNAWPAEAAGPFDLVVSSLAIHHLDRARKATLARQVFESLRPGGAFLNLDYLEPPSPAVQEQYVQAQRRLSGGADEGDHHATGGHASGTLLDYFEDLHAAGFVDVDVFWKRLAIAVVGGTRPAG